MVNHVVDSHNDRRFDSTDKIWLEPCRMKHVVMTFFQGCLVGESVDDVLEFTMFRKVFQGYGARRGEKELKIVVLAGIDR